MERLKKIWKSIKRFFYLWYLRIRYYKKLFTIGTNQPYNNLDILKLSTDTNVLVLYKSKRPIKYYRTKVILWKD
mgnify:CR=1 FL=1